MSADRRSTRDRMTPAVRRLELLRERRVRQDVGVPLAQPLSHLQRKLETESSQRDPISQIFSRHVPEELAKACSLRLTSGTLRVRVADSSTRFALDRLLRAGVKDQIIRSSMVPIRDIRLESGGSTRARR